MKDLTSTSFGYVIAFLLPGIFGLYALSPWVPEVGVFLQSAFKADASVGPSVVFLLVAVGMGLWVSALRFFLFEKLLCKRHKLPPNLFARLVEAGKLSFFKAVVDEHYRYHQFYGGCAVALLVLFSGWVHQVRPLSWRGTYISIGFVVLEVVLVMSGRQAYIKYVERGCTIVSELETIEGATASKESRKND